MAKLKIPGLSFSWKRALGLSRVKSRISRKTGIPLSRGGLSSKIGRAILKGLTGRLGR